MHINLHYLKIALIFSMEISRDYSSRHGVRMCRITYFFGAPRPRSERGGGGVGGGGGIHPPPPPGCEMGSKYPASLGLMFSSVQ